MQPLKPLSITSPNLQLQRAAVPHLGQARASEPAGAMRTEQKGAKAAQEFEAFVLQTFIQEMLPKDSQALFGKGVAGESWRAMLAEKIAANVAKAGGVGIAAALQQSPQSAPRPVR